ncbi:MAG: ABC transporter ATP-binding protein [Candidatus Latescibacteria bacterium]|nr:ABC transporter ATP-binding protein [Candidatus Latescibacterota bacterium]
MAALLELRQIHAGYGALEVLKGISLRVEEGEIVTLIGANGAGKSTTLMTISGLIRARTGEVLYDGVSLRRLAPHQIVALGLCQVPEGRRIFAELTVMENLEMGAYTRRDRAGRAGDLEQVSALFPRLRERASQKAGTLSGGEQQMLAIGRALMARPRLLLLDEPSLGLAPLLVQRIFEVIRELNSRGTTILLVEQNANEALQIAHRGYVMETGRITLEDEAGALLRNPQVREAYLGYE